MPDEIVMVDAEVIEEPALPKKRGRPRKAAINGEVAVRPVNDLGIEEDWPYEWVELEGDRLAVRKPTQQALQGFSLANSEFNSPQTRNSATGYFLRIHMSEGTYSRVFQRMMNPNEPDYTIDTIGELAKMIIELTTGPQPDTKSKV